MITPQERAHKIFREFGQTMLDAASLADSRKRWEDWATQHADHPDVDRRADRLANVAVEWISALGVSKADPLLVFLHGGGYISGSIKTHIGVCAHISQATRCRILAVDYRLAPEHAFPAAIHDVAAVLAALYEQGEPAAKLGLVGDSAGGGLAVSALLELRSRHLTMPGAAICIGPWVDLTVSGASMLTNAVLDPVIQGDAMRSSALAYLQGTPANDPLASSIFADLRGLPPLLIQVGLEEALLDDARTLTARARECGVDVTLEEYAGVVHGWHQFAAFMPEAEAALTAIERFVDATLRK